MKASSDVWEWGLTKQSTHKKSWVALPSSLYTKSSLKEKRRKGER